MVATLTSPNLQPNRHYALHESSTRFDKVHLYQLLDSHTDDNDNSHTDDNHRDKLLHWRFEITIIDNAYKPGARQIPCAIFLIPGGRETEYLFSTKQGLQNVAESANCLRLLAVSLSRYHNYPDSAEGIQLELSSECDELILPKLAAFVPPKLPKSDGFEDEGQHDKIPFMAIAGIGNRQIIVEGESSSTGPYIVEQCETQIDFPISETVHVRRLYFKHSPQLIQSEAILLNDISSEIDHLKMSFEHNWYFAAGMLLCHEIADARLFEPESDIQHMRKNLVIGLGGGSLLNFLSIFQPHMHHTVIEIDSSVVEIAKSYFGFCEGPQMAVHVGDGLAISSLNSNMSIQANGMLNFQAGSISSIVIDVDSKDLTIGLSCPPEKFIDSTYLSTLSNILSPNGILAVNVSARNPAMLNQVIESLYSVFGTLLIGGDDEDECLDKTQDTAINVVLFAFKKKDYKLSKRMNLVQTVHEFCNVIGLSTPHVRSQLEDCLASIHIYNKKSTIKIDDNNKCGKSKKKGGRKKKKK